MGVGAPSYVSGAQVWNGTAETLKAKPMSTKRIPTVTIGSASGLPPTTMPISASRVSPVNPNTSDIP